ncbi:SLATT domain-containing protein [Actinomadura sp. ATCC 31491]|uniref:SLATT domain-containing protein n=1 Tax=Actinomadura luzonensis TaxID=2805427 RepID=A0ABT0G285_9ACTN|nr:SLATT domain-containing protein [Actinomadura luzonensis]MCK2218295.1 SLATT domain-containing protein [Actinomadura luzonensis]
MKRDAQFRALYRELRIQEQSRFYERRSEEYEGAHRQAVMVRNVLLLLSALVGAAGQFTSGTGRAACGVAAAVLAALAGAVTAFEALIGFAQLHKLYADAAHSLRAAAIDWDAAASDADVSEQIERVEQILRTENGQWGQLMLQKEGTLPLSAEPVPEDAP